MAINNFELPDQSDSKKDLKWHVDHGNKFINFISGLDYNGRLTEIAKLEQAYLAAPVKRESVTKPNGYDLGGEYETYPLIEGTLDDIMGKYLSRPPERTVYSVNRDAINSKLDAKIDMLKEEMLRGINEDLNKQHDLGLQTENPDLELPDDIEEFFSKSFKTSAEELSDELITQFYEVEKNKDRIKPMLIEYLYGDTCACEIGEKDGHPTLNVYRYDECYFDVDPKKEVQDEISVFCSFHWLTEGEIYNTYALTNKNKKLVKSAFEALEDGSSIQDDFDLLQSGTGTYSNCSKGISYKNWSDIKSASKRLRVLKMMWKSRRDVKSLEYTHKRTGKTIHKLLPDDYKERSRDKITITSTETVHMIHMLGPEIVLDWGEVENVNRRIDNPGKAYLPVVALVGKTYVKGNDVRSLAKKLLGLQVYASDILYQMKQFINSLEGKVIIYDAAQTPKQFINSEGAERAINRVFHHMRKDKAVIINSADKKDRHTFNQFTTLDLSNRGYLKDMMDALFLVEDLAAKFSGLTKENKEGGEKYQTATSVNRAVIASNSRIDVYFEPFDSLMSTMLTRFLQVAKLIYSEGEVFAQTFGDIKNKFFALHKDFWDADLGIYIGDSSKNMRDKSVIDRGIELTLSNAQDPRLIKDLISALESDSATESMGIFERSIVAMEKIAEQNAQREQQIQEAQMKDKQDERTWNAQENQKDRESQEKIAQIHSGNKARVAVDDRHSNELIKAAELETKKEIEEGKKKESAEKKAS